MLPDKLSESYRQYKADTNSFVTWLSNTAVSQGYKFLSADTITTTLYPDPAVPLGSGTIGRLKGKARKEAKRADSSKAPLPPKTHNVSVKELLAQAEYIATFKKPLVQVPSGIQYVLKRAINARRKCAAWFQGSIVERETSNATHQHFIWVLESVYGILEPHFVLTKLSKKSTAPTPNIGTRASDTSTPAYIENRFGALELDDLDQTAVDLLLSETPNTAAKKASKPPVSAAAETYELGTTVDEELPFLIFCLFEDLHKIQCFIKQTWQEVVEAI
jgi:hypothetical protein